VTDFIESPRGLFEIVLAFVQGRSPCLKKGAAWRAFPLCGTFAALLPGPQVAHAGPVQPSREAVVDGFVTVFPDVTICPKRPAPAKAGEPVMIMRDWRRR
jgi:hypothetical protein